jgi:hypothetical protein
VQIVDYSRKLEKCFESFVVVKSRKYRLCRFPPRIRIDKDRVAIGRRLECNYIEKIGMPET